MTIELDAQELGSQVHLTVHIKRMQQFAIRQWIAFRLINLAQLIGWIDIEIHQQAEAYVYMCPECGQDVLGYKPVLGLDAVFTCRHCHYQFLVQRPNIVDSEPVIVKEQWEEDYDEYGCHWAKPYGFVIMAGCPDHD